MTETKLIIFLLLFSLSRAAAEPTQTAVERSDPPTHLPLPLPFTASYEVRKNGKLMGQQTTQWQQLKNQHYQLKDHMSGTHGLASWSGFKRDEQSVFQLIDNNWYITNHDMRQKVMFKKWNYQFSRQQDTVSGKHKDKAFKLTHQPSLFSTHSLPIYAAALACQGNTDFTVQVLKSDRPKIYQFTAKADNSGQILLSRQYPKDSKKRSQSWLDRKQNCLTTKTLFDNGKGTVIKTKLVAYKPLTEQRDLK